MNNEENPYTVYNNIAKRKFLFLKVTKYTLQ